MKVLFVTHYSYLYGANKSLLGLIKELRNYDVDPLVVCPSEGPLTDLLKEENLPYTIIPFKNWVSTDINKFKVIGKNIVNYYYVYKFKRFIEFENIDLIHSNSSATHIGALLAKCTGIKHIWHIREFLQEDYNLKFELGLNKSVSLMNQSEIVIAISEKIKYKYIKYIDINRIRMIYNGVPFNETIDSNKDYKSTNELKLLLVGIIVPQKGHEEAIKAIYYLYKNKGIKCYLNIVGDGEYRVHYENLVDNLKINHLVKFWGYQKDIDYFLKTNDIALMCSKSEAFGRTTVESMLAGLPVIGSDSGATNEIIVNDSTGLLYKTGNYQDLADKIEFLNNNKGKIKEFGENGKERAIQNFTSKKNAQKIYEIYSSLVWKKGTN